MILAKLLLLIFCRFDDEEATAVKRKRRFLVHPRQQRELEGENYNLYKELLDGETQFYKYFRMTKEWFALMENKQFPMSDSSSTIFRHR
ncbi:unnamed protein product [Euphydryas editha]|uniref:Uncharacterized protein n=1 Tax=Euphydryas editha TaxID=104508 RepID=A0AAU9U215_EUPED|nr:unnamed protein product [Euphydryas editha]